MSGSPNRRACEKRADVYDDRNAQQNKCRPCKNGLYFAGKKLRVKAFYKLCAVVV